MECGNIKYSGHAVRRMFERKISEPELLKIIASGEVIASYPDDRPYPSYLLIGYSENRPLHVLVAKDNQTLDCYVITAYVPDSEIWSDDYRKRRDSG